MDKFKNVCDFYAITRRLKILVRTGWQDNNISAERLETVAEHIYGTQMLAFAVNSEFELGMDIEKISLMLAFHELGECIIGDLTFKDPVSKEEKHKLEIDAVCKILSPLKDREHILDLFYEYENRKTKEAIFAHGIDKIEAFLQCKYYFEKNQCNFNCPHKDRCDKVNDKGLKPKLSKYWKVFDVENPKEVYGEIFTHLEEYINDNQIFDVN